MILSTREAGYRSLTVTLFTSHHKLWSQLYNPQHPGQRIPQALVIPGLPDPGERLERCLSIKGKSNLVFSNRPLQWIYSKYDIQVVYSHDSSYRSTLANAESGENTAFPRMKYLQGLMKQRPRHVPLGVGLMVVKFENLVEEGKWSKRENGLARISFCQCVRCENLCSKFQDEYSGYTRKTNLNTNRIAIIHDQSQTVKLRHCCRCN